MANLSKAIRLLKPLVAAFEDEDADKATDLCKQMLAALQANDSDDAEAGKGAKKAATPQRNAMRARMGLPPIGAPPPRAIEMQGTTMLLRAVGVRR